MPRIGTRKLHFLLAETLQKHDINIGRDKLFDLLEEYGLLIRRRRRKRVNTTDANHPFRKYPNLIKDLPVLHPNQLWVSDITYISLTDRFCYLSLVTDAYSRKIVGYCLYPTLQKEGPLAALDMALDSLCVNPAQHLVHHSDRGLQYCCSDYIARLESKEVIISMTEKGDPYENAIAERVNGILKEEFLLDIDFENLQKATETVVRAIKTYNQQRPHASCNYLTPEQASQQQGPLKSKWRKKTETELIN
jgi:putative transposase